MHGRKVATNWFDITSDASVRSALIASSNRPHICRLPFISDGVEEERNWMKLHENVWNRGRKTSLPSKTNQSDSSVVIFGSSQTS